MGEAQVLELAYGDFLDHIDLIYERHRDPHQLNEDAERVYQSRRYRRMLREEAED